MNIFRRTLLLPVLLLACADEPVEVETCRPVVVEGDWDNPLRSEVITRLGAPAHIGVDSLAAPHETAVLQAKFAYGTTSADLEGERVAVFIETGECEWVDLGEHITDRDGRVHVDFDTDGLALGEYVVRFVVVADLSEVHSKLHIIDRDVPIVVFDIDGTLTTSDIELVDGIVIHHVGAASDTLYDLAGSPLTRAQWLSALDVALDESAMVWEGGVDVVHSYAERGIQPVYITGRPYLYDGLTRRWMEDYNLPPGPLFMVQDVLEALPQGVAAFKARTLRQLQSRGHTIVAAYGNAMTDICAYEEAGIPSDSTFIIGPNAGAACEDGEPSVALTSYVDHLSTLP